MAEYKSGVARWSRPLSYSDELLSYFDQPYMESMLRNGLAREAWRKYQKDTEEVSLFGFVRSMTVLSSRIKSRLNWRELQVLDVNSFTVGEIAFLLARKRNLTYGLTALHHYSIFMDTAPKHESIGWTFLLADMGIPEAEAMTAYKVFEEAGMSLDEVAAFYNAGICTPSTIRVAHIGGMDIELTRSLIAGA